MINIILLGGRNLEQQRWIREVERELSPYFAATHVLDYQHWKRGVVEEDIPAEIANLAALVDSLEGKEYAVFGKSMGTFVTAEAIRQRRINPRYCVFAGTPIISPFSEALNETHRIKELFQRYETPTLFIQNFDERFMRPAELDDTLC
ncbi:MAG: alpha/beta hydrolase, partial [Nanoarchaeota archaeon]